MQGPGQVADAIKVAHVAVARADQVLGRGECEIRGVVPPRFGQDAVDQGFPVAAQRFDKRPAQIAAVRGYDRPVAKLGVEVPGDVRPGRSDVPRPGRVHHRPAGPRGASQLVHLDPVKALPARVGQGDEALRIIGMPPGPVGGDDLLKAPAG